MANGRSRHQGSYIFEWLPAWNWDETSFTSYCRTNVSLKNLMEPSCDTLSLILGSYTDHGTVSYFTLIILLITKLHVFWELSPFFHFASVLALKDNAFLIGVFIKTKIFLDGGGKGDLAIWTFKFPIFLVGKN